MDNETTEFGDLLGQTLTRIDGADPESDRIHLYTDGVLFVLYHQQDCCENVRLVDVCGDIADLVGEPLLLAEMVTNEDREPRTEEVPDVGPYDDSYMWTFYKMATAKGYVTLRWLGESNGYYGEQVDFRRIPSV